MGKANHRRRSIRLEGYDYTQAGAYFVTPCVQDRRCLLGGVQDGQVHLSPLGRIVQDCWAEIPAHFPVVVLDAYVIMPNHVHGILMITEPPIGGGQAGETQVGEKRIEATRLSGTYHPQRTGTDPYPAIY